MLYMTSTNRSLPREAGSLPSSLPCRDRGDRPVLAGSHTSGQSQANRFHTQPRQPGPAKAAILNWNYLQMRWISCPLVLVSSRSYGLDSKNQKAGGLFNWLDLFSLGKTNGEIKSISKLSMYSWEG